MNRLSSLRRNRYRNGLLQGTGSVISLAIAVILIVLIALRFIAPGVFARITTPIWNIGAASTSFVRGVTSTESKVELRAGKERLSSENASLQAQNAALAAQVSDLTKLLGARTEPQNSILASVLARPPVAPYDVLIIDQGRDAGVAVGALAMGPGGTPIGTVGEADARQSRIALYSTSGFKNNGWVGQSRIPINLTGAGAGAFRAEVSKGAGAVVGDAVFIAGQGAFPIGTIVRIEDDPSSPNSELDIRPYTNPFSLTWVTVSR